MTDGNEAQNNHAPTAQASVSGGGLVALIISIIAIVAAVALMVVVWQFSLEVARTRQAVEEATGRNTESAVQAAMAAERANIAERRANISELYAKQVFVELNRLGYPVKTPAEEHSVAPVEKP